MEFARTPLREYLLEKIFLGYLVIEIIYEYQVEGQDAVNLSINSRWIDCFCEGEWETGGTQKAKFHS